MRPRFAPPLFVALLTLATGCGLNTAVLQKGGNGRTGVLLNYSCGAHPCDPIDPTKPTIVITHGWNPLPNRIHTTFGWAGAQALKCRCGDSYNILSWDWNAVKISPFRDEPLRIGLEQGRMMAAALRCRGVNPCRTQIIAHSLGTIVASQAAVCLSDRGRMAQLTLLDPPENYHDEIFCQLQPTRHACVVENYWSPGISGYGDHAGYPGVQNYIVRGTTPVRGIVDLSVSNHVYVMRWYYETMRCPSMRCGFQNSVMLGCCGRGGPCYGQQAEELPFEEALVLAPPADRGEIEESVAVDAAAPASDDLGLRLDAEPHVATASAGSRRR